MSVINKHQMFNDFNAISCHYTHLLNTMGQQSPILIELWHNGLYTEANVHVQKLD